MLVPSTTSVILEIPSFSVCPTERDSMLNLRRLIIDEIRLSTPVLFSIIAMIVWRFCFGVLLTLFSYGLKCMSTIV